jgi:nicotinamide mononucleotide transporter
VSTIEWIAFVINVICVYLIVREKDVNWPIGVLGSLALAWVFWEGKLYAQLGLQVFYVFECLYGWWMWTRKDRSSGLKLIRIGRTRRQMAIWLTLIGVAGVALLYPLFRWTDDPAPFWDSVITIASLIAEYMLCLKLLESWSVYLAADLVSLVVLGVLGMWITFGTYLVFTVLCAMGVREWIKRHQKATAIAEATAGAAVVS